MQVSDSLATVRDSALKFGLRIIVARRCVLVDGAQDQGIVRDIVQGRANEYGWEEEAIM